MALSRCSSAFIFRAARPFSSSASTSSFDVGKKKKIVYKTKSKRKVPRYRIQTFKQRVIFPDGSTSIIDSVDYRDTVVLQTSPLNHPAWAPPEEMARNEALRQAALEAQRTGRLARFRDRSRPSLDDDDDDDED